jgi:hypothetical protein
MKSAAIDEKTGEERPVLIGMSFGSTLPDELKEVTP